MDLFKNIKLFSHVFFAAYAPGGGNVIKAIVEELGIEHFSLIVGGPSIKIFEQEYKNNFISVEEFTALAKSSGDYLLVTSLSGNNDHELELIDIANKTNMKSACVLEHWSNYKMRFYKLKDQTSQREIILPNEVWVLDLDALNVYAQAGLPENLVKIIPNFYFQQVQRSIKNYQIEDPKNILYISEYLNVHQPNTVPGSEKLQEHLIVEELCRSFETLKNKFTLTIRLHPHENDDKYDTVVKKYPNVILSNRATPLPYDLAHAKVVLGIHSFALAVSALSNIPTFSIAEDQRILPIRTIKYYKSFQSLFIDDNFLKVINEPSRTI